jgi:hypothetical protein
MRSTDYKLSHFVILSFSSHFFLNPKCCTQHPQPTFHYWRRNLVPYPYETTGKFVNFRLIKSLRFKQITNNSEYKVLNTDLHLGPLPSTACFCTWTSVLPFHHSSDSRRLILSQIFSYINTQTFSSRLFLQRHALTLAPRRDSPLRG